MKQILLHLNEKRLVNGSAFVLHDLGASGILIKRDMVDQVCDAVDKVLEK